jgi:proliferating cell nuclear antigen
MVSARIKAGIFKEAVNAIAAITDEATFKFTPSGLTVKAVDENNVSMVDVRLDAKAFDLYISTGLDLDIFVDRLNAIISEIDDERNIELRYNESTKKLEIKEDSFQYLVFVPDRHLREPVVMDVNFSNHLAVATSYLKKIVDASEAISDYIFLGVCDNKFYAETYNGEDDDSIKLELQSNELLAIEAPVDARTLYTLDYIRDMVEVMSKVQYVKIDLYTDYPVKFTFAINGTGSFGEVIYLLAPRIDME